MNLPASTLGNWLLVVGTLAVLNTVQSFASAYFPNLSLMAMIYGPGMDQVSPLATRLMGAWNLMSAIVRLHCAYDMTNKAIYRTTIWSFIIALGHFASEVFLFGTADITSAGVLSPLAVSSISIVWMTLEYRKFLMPEKRD